MKGITLKQLREAINVVKTSEKFQAHRNVVPELEFAEQFLAGTIQSTVYPQDPRLGLKLIGYKEDHMSLKETKEILDARPGTHSL